MKRWSSAEQAPLTTALRLLGVVLGSLLAAGIALCEETPPPDAPAEPIRITADRLVSDSDKRTAEFTGNVKAVQARTVITADRLKLTYGEDTGGRDGTDANSIESIEALGHVRITFDNRVAVSEKAVYTTIDRKLVLSGPESSITSGQDAITGHQITFFRDTGRVEIIGDDQNQVKAIIHSEQSGLN